MTVAAAASMAVWMLVSGCKRMALWWSLLFIGAITIVAATKIAFIVWGAQISTLNFRALSGHATGATAVFVILLYLLLQGRGRQYRALALIAAMVIGGVLSALLVLHGEHSFAEASAGWALGALAGGSAIHLAGCPVALPRPSSLIWAGFVFLSGVLMLRQLPLGYWMWRAAKIVAHHSGVLSLATVHL